MSRRTAITGALVAVGLAVGALVLRPGTSIDTRDVGMVRPIDRTGDPQPGGLVHVVSEEVERSVADPATPPGDQAGPAVTVADQPYAPPPMSGRVVDETGAPIAGADVRVLTWDNRLREKSGAPVLAEAQTITDAEGQFRIEPPLDDHFALRVSRPGFATTVIGGAPQEGTREAPSYGDVVLLPGVTLAGVTLGPDGEPVARTRIVAVARNRPAALSRAFPDETPHAVAVSDELGRFRIEGASIGPWSLDGHHPRYLAGGATGVARPAANEGIVIRLGRASSLRGLVVGLPADARPVSVSCRTVQEDDDADSYGYDYNGQRFALEADGTFEVTGLAPESEVWLDLWSGTYARHRSQRRSARVTARAGEQGVRLIYSAGFDVTLQAIDALSREPVRNFHATIEFGDGWNDLATPKDPGSDFGYGWPEGRATAHGLVAPRPDMPLNVRLRAHGYDAVDFERLEFPSSGLLDLGKVELTPESPVDGEPPVLALVRVRRADGSPASGCILRLVRRLTATNGQRPERGQRIVADDQGVAEVRSHEAGPVTVSLDPSYAVGLFQPGCEPTLYASDFEPISKDVTLVLGSVAEVAIDEPPRATVTLRVERNGQPAPAASVVLHSYAESHDDRSRSSVRLGTNRAGWAKLDDRGERTFSHLAPGDWFVSVRDPSDGAHAVRPLRLEVGFQERSVSLDVSVITGRVVSTGGIPVANALVMMNPERRSDSSIFDAFHGRSLGAAEATVAVFSSGAPHRATTDRQGRFTLRLAHEGVDFVIDATADAMTTARSSSFRTDLTSFDVGDLVLQRAGTLRIRSPEGVPDPWVVVAPPSASNRVAFETGHRPDFFDGVALQRALAPGVWRVRWCPDDAKSIDDSHDVDVEVVAGEVTDVVLKAPPR